MEDSFNHVMIIGHAGKPTHVIVPYDMWNEMVCTTIANPDAGIPRRSRARKTPIPELPVITEDEFKLIVQQADREQISVLKALRRRCAMTIEVFSQRLVISSSTVSAYESLACYHKRSIGLRYLHRVEKVLSIPNNALMRLYRPQNYAEQA